MAESQLTPEAQRAVESYVRSLVGKWLQWIGLVNVVTLGGMLAYVVLFFQIWPPSASSPR
jgi:hypothetical protein